MKKVPLVMSFTEVQKLFKATDDPKYRMLWKVLFYCGLRRSEGCRLNIKDIDFDKKELWVINGKGGKTAPVPLVEKILVDLKEYIEKYKDKFKNGYLFPSRKGEHIDGNWARHIFKRYLKKANLNLAYHPHTLRHSIINYLVDVCEVPLEVASRIARHSSIQVTSDVYTHTSTRRVRDYMEKAFSGRCKINDGVMIDVEFEKFKELLEDKFKEFYKMLEEHKKNIHKLLCSNIVVKFQKPKNT